MPSQTLSQQQRLLQKMTPQQVLYLKLLQLPTLVLEQRIQEELENNPLLEISEDQESSDEMVKEPTEQSDVSDSEDRYTFEDFMNDKLEGYKVTANVRDDEDHDELPLPSEVPFSQRLINQLRELDLSEEELILGEEIIGNIDEDGYLRRELELIIQDLNLSHGFSLTLEQGEEVLKKILHLDPPGIGARNLQECLIAQLEVGEFPKNISDIALKILTDHWNDLTMKHYDELKRKMGIDTPLLKEALDLIQKLNPKPGEGKFTPHQNYIIPDFIVENTGGEFIVSLNDKNIPNLRINKRYQELMSKRRGNGTDSKVKDFIRKQFESAKWFIASIHQRRETMLKVMRAIVKFQREFFETGENLRPMIYKDIAEEISMDISTISRVVNGKYVQTEFGVFELRYFFSDTIRKANGEEVSNKEVKKLIKEIITAEDSQKPYTDDQITEILRKNGLHIARRTVAKYRESMKIPIARLRRKL